MAAEIAQEKGFNEGSLAVGGAMVRASGGLTEADRTGIPSENDLKDLALGPAKNIQPPLGIKEQEADSEVVKAPVVFPAIAPASSLDGGNSVDHSIEGSVEEES